MASGTARNKKQTTAKNKTQPSPVHPRHHRLLRWLLGIVGVVVLLVLATVIAFKVSPWPGALFIRYEFNKGGAKTSQALEKHVPGGVTQVENRHYRQHDKDAYLDVFYPSTMNSTKHVLPTVVWVHGGAWVSGDKDGVDNYLKIVAARGYTVVGVNYSVAPGKKYPVPLLQVNDALRYIQRHADELHIDDSRIFLAGDSAGSQIVAQVGAIVTSSAYAKEAGISSAMPADHLRGMVLNCGAYDLALPNYKGPDGKFLNLVLWAYAGTKDFMHDKNIQHASVVDYVDRHYPPSFITAGNADPLETQSREFAGKLQALGVPTDTLFYAHDHQPALQHEYQFNLDIADGQQALARILGFLDKYDKE